MATLLYFILLTTFLPLLTVAQQMNANGSVPEGASLTATNSGIPWLSPSGDFTFGFQQMQETDNFLLSIWYDKIPEKTIVWYPNDGPMVPRGSKVELIGERGLVLSDPQGKQVWSSGISGVAFGFMNDTGNFIILDNNHSKMWESFEFPADTILPTQVIEIGKEINSKLSKTNFSAGKFPLTLLQNGNLVLQKRDVSSGSLYNVYYRSGTRDASNATNSVLQLIYDDMGYMYILRRNGQIVELNKKGAVSSTENYQRATLDSNGVFNQYYHLKNPSSNASWEVLKSIPKNMCEQSDDGFGAAACGVNSVCNFDGHLANCECPKGFSLLDSNDPNGDCKPDFTPSCDEGYDKDLFDFIELTNIDWPGSDYVHVNPSNEEKCRDICLQDCFCAAAVYRDNECWKKKLPLTNGKKDPTLVVKVFLKHQKGDVPRQNPFVSSQEHKNQRSWIFAFLSSCVFIIFILTGVICVALYLICKKSTRNYHLTNSSIDTNLPRFTYQDLVEATDGFKDELGKGAFGIVYKGVIGATIVAVKKLDKVFQDDVKEFHSEVNAIALTHHKNLVRLLGYSNEGEQ